MCEAPACRLVIAVGTLALSVVTGCASHVAHRPVAGAEATQPGISSEPPVRSKLSKSDTGLLEERNVDLSKALRAFRAVPSAENHQRVASEYARLGVADAALDHFDKAVALNPKDSASYEGRARVWRDIGSVSLALADAHRAVFFRPGSASAHNTLGTVFQQLGSAVDARAEFERAAALAPTAAYPLSNLCYVALLLGEPETAERLCRRAIEMDPTLGEARRNLGVVLGRYASEEALREVFGSGVAPETREYWLGLALFENQRFAAAAAAFERAVALDPTMTIARDAARFSRDRAVAGTNGITR